MSGKYSKTGWKKYEFPPDMITQEEGEKNMKLTKYQLQRMLKERVFAKVQVAAYNGDAIAEEKWKAWLIKSEAKSIREKLNDEFINDFIFWLQGRSPYNAKEFDRIVYDEEGQPLERESVTGTPWGNKPLTGVAGVSEFLDQGIDRRQRVITYLSKLKLRTPRNLNECYLYFKYIVREVGIDDNACHEVDTFSQFDSPTSPFGGPMGPIGPSPPLYNDLAYKTNFRLNFDVAKNDPALYIGWLMQRAPPSPFISRGLLTAFMAINPGSAAEMEAAFAAGAISAYGPVDYIPTTEEGQYLFASALEQGLDDTTFTMDYFSLSAEDRDIMIATAYTFFAAGAPSYAGVGIRRHAEAPAGVPGAYAEAADVAAYRELLGGKKTDAALKRTEKTLEKMKEKRERIIKRTAAFLDSKKVPTAAHMELREALKAKRKDVRIYGPRRGGDPARVAREDLKDIKEAGDLLKKGKRTRARAPKPPAATEAEFSETDERTRFPAGRPGFKFNKATGFFHRPRTDLTNAERVKEFAREYGGKNREAVAELVDALAAAPPEAAQAVAEVIKVGGPEAVVEIDRRMPVQARKFNVVDYLTDIVGVHPRVLNTIRRPMNVAQEKGDYPILNDDLGMHTTGALGRALKVPGITPERTAAMLQRAMIPGPIATETANRIHQFRDGAKISDIKEAATALEILEKERSFSTVVYTGMMKNTGLEESPEIAARLYDLSEHLQISRAHFHKALLGNENYNFGFTPEIMRARPDKAKELLEQYSQDLTNTMADVKYKLEQNPYWTVDNIIGANDRGPLDDRIVNEINTDMERLFAAGSRAFVGFLATQLYPDSLEKKQHIPLSGYLKKISPLHRNLNGRVDSAIMRLPDDEPVAAVAPPAPAAVPAPAPEPPVAAEIPPPEAPLERVNDADERQAQADQRKRLRYEAIRRDIGAHPVLANYFNPPAQYSRALLEYLRDPETELARSELRNPSATPRLLKKYAHRIQKNLTTPKSLIDTLHGRSKLKGQREYLNYDLQLRASAAHQGIATGEAAHAVAETEEQRQEAITRTNIHRQNLQLYLLQDIRKYEGGEGAAEMLAGVAKAPRTYVRGVEAPEPVAPPPEEPPQQMEIEEPVGAFAPPEAAQAVEVMERAAEGGPVPGAYAAPPPPPEGFDPVRDQPMEPIPWPEQPMELEEPPGDVEMAEEIQNEDAAALVDLPPDAPRLAELNAGPVGEIVRNLARVYDIDRGKLTRIQEQFREQLIVPYAVYAKRDTHRTGLKYEGPWDEIAETQRDIGVAASPYGGALRVASALRKAGIEPFTEATIVETPSSALIKGTVSKFAKAELLAKYWGDGNFGDIAEFLGGEILKDTPMSGINRTLPKLLADISIRSLSLEPEDAAMEGRDEAEARAAYQTRLFDQFQRVGMIASYFDQVYPYTTFNMRGQDMPSITFGEVERIVEQHGLRNLFSARGDLDPDLPTGIEDYKNLEAAEFELKMATRFRNSINPGSVFRSGDGVLTEAFTARTVQQVRAMPLKYAQPMGLTTDFPERFYSTEEQSAPLFGQNHPIQAIPAFRGNMGIAESPEAHIDYTKKMDESLVYALVEGYYRASEALPTGANTYVNNLGADGALLMLNQDINGVAAKSESAAMIRAMREQHLQREFGDLGEGNRGRLDEFKQHLDYVTNRTSVMLYSALHALAESDQHKKYNDPNRNTKAVGMLNQIHANPARYTDNPEPVSKYYYDAFSSILAGAKSIAMAGRALNSASVSSFIRSGLEGSIFPGQVIRDVNDAGEASIMPAPGSLPAPTIGNPAAILPVFAQSLETLTRQMQDICANEDTARRMFGHMFPGGEFLGSSNIKDKVPSVVWDTLANPRDQVQRNEEDQQRREELFRYAEQKTQAQRAWRAKT